jgi:hypothetical protein
LAYLDWLALGEARSRDSFLGQIGFGLDRFLSTGVGSLLPIQPVRLLLESDFYPKTARAKDCCLIAMLLTMWRCLRLEAFKGSAS